MFINCKKNLVIRVGDEITEINKDFIGEIPDALAGHWMIQAAIKDGTIATPAGTSDKKLEQADTAAAEKAEASDIRPDASPNSEADGAEKAEAAGGEKKPKK